MDDVTCEELVERITDYLERVLGPDEFQRLNTHLARCDDCEAYVAQMRKTVQATNNLRRQIPPPVVESELLRIYQEWQKRGRP